MPRLDEKYTISLLKQHFSKEWYYWSGQGRIDIGMEFPAVKMFTEMSLDLSTHILRFDDGSEINFDIDNIDDTIEHIKKYYHDDINKQKEQLTKQINRFKRYAKVLKSIH